MGTYYGLGVVKTFQTRTIAALTTQELEKAVNERLNLDLFDVTITNHQLHGTLKANLFQDRIEDFFSKLQAIVTSSSVKFYWEEFGNDIDQYPYEDCTLKFSDAQNHQITIHMGVVFLFLEGKVSAEKFDLEPSLMNWLFRHSNFDNILAGAIISDIIG